MILATDLDRTLLPNGHEPYDNSLSTLFDVIRKKELLLVYVTGRSLSLVLDAQKEFNVETPDYLLADVGSSLYRNNNGTLVPDEDWTRYLKENTPNWNNVTMHDAIKFDGLCLQEKEKQNTYKLSYYLDTEVDIDKIVSTIEKIVKEDLAIDASIIYSVDPLTDDGLVDILPRIATKVTALEFLRERLGLDKKEVVYSGDSGNDILPLTNGYKSILVANAHDDARLEIEKIVKEKGFEETLYKATGFLHPALNGNYSSGILEGLLHFNIITTNNIK